MAKQVSYLLGGKSLAQSLRPRSKRTNVGQVDSLRFGASEGPTVRSSSTGTTGTSALTSDAGGYLTVNITVPSDARVGDLLLFGLCTIGGSPQTPTGWTARVTGTTTANDGGGNYFCQLFTYTKFCVAGDIGATITWTLMSAPGGTSASCIMLAIKDASVAAPTTSAPNYTSGAGGTSSGSVALASWSSPAVFLGNKPARVEFFAQSPAAVYPQTIPTFSSYTGTGVEIAAASHDYGRIVCYFVANSSSFAAAGLSSNKSGAFAAAGLALRGF